MSHLCVKGFKGALQFMYAALGFGLLGHQVRKVIYAYVLLFYSGTNAVIVLYISTTPSKY